MEDIVQFSKQLNKLIEDNNSLKDSLRRTEEYLKLAISMNGFLQFRTIENADEETYKNFIDNTEISFGGNESGGMKLLWKNPVSVNISGKYTSFAYKAVNIDEIREIFNSKKDKK